MAIGCFSAKDMKRALGATRLGFFPALTGWTYAGTPVATVEVARNNLFRLMGSKGECLAVFQDFVYLDD